MVPTKKVEKTPYEIYKVLVARNAEFFENSLINQEASGSLEDLEIIKDEDTHPSINTRSHHEAGDIKIDEPQSDIIPIRRSTRTRNAPNCTCLYIDSEEHELGDLGEPANYKAALLDPKSYKWLDAMNVEMQSMKDNEVWDLVDLPRNGKTVGSKWLFKKKTDMDGVVHTFKACLVAKGFTQTYSVDYEETFSPVAEIRAIRILIAIAAYYDYEIWQMDVKIAFLNQHLSKEVYMEQPEGFVKPKYPNRKFGFTQNHDEPCVYQKDSGSNVTFLILYVDDMLIMGNHIPMLQDVKSYLRRCFAMKDLGEAAYILGIKIYIDRSWRLIGLCQSAYIEKILKILHMENSKHGSIPMQEKLKLSKSQGASTHAEMRCMQNVPYASAVGSIMYVVRCTRPDVAFAQNITSRFQQNPCDLHWTTTKNIRKYVRNTKDMFLDTDDLKSQTGYVFILNGGVVDWKSTKQSIFTTSSAEAEYIAAFDASKEAVWARKFISELGIVPTIEEPINMYCDNTGAIAIANESRITKGARHFRAKVHYLREVIEYGDIKLEKVHTYDNLADHFPKRGVTDWYQEPRVMSTYPIIVPSNSDIEDTFSSTNSPDYTPASPDYFLASPGNISLDPSKDLTKYLLASLAISPFHDDPYMKVVQAYNATNNELPIPSPQAPIASSTVLPSSLVLPLSPLFDS
ncbi:retrotransposon protein, putative, ty1-copia subclass [Tanacetum coccineum]